MVYAFSKLSAFDKKFRYSFLTALSFTLIAAFVAIDRFIVDIASDLVLNVASAFLAAAIILLHFTMFSAIVSITLSVGLKKITGKARRNLIVMILYYTLYSLTFLSRNWLESNYEKAAYYLYLFLTVFQFVWLFMNLVLIGSCLKWIGEEGEEIGNTASSRKNRLYSFLSEKEDRLFSPREKRSGNNRKKK